MNQRKIISLLLGILLFSTIFLVFLALPSDSSKNRQKDVEVGEMFSLIKNKRVKEIRFRQSQVDLKDLDGNAFTTTIGNDSMREALLKTVTDFNAANESPPIKITEEATSSGWDWILLINSLPTLILFVLCMLIAFYLGTISNKSKG